MREELLNLLKQHAYRKGEFKLSSGRTSEHYCNCTPVTLSGQGLLLTSCMLLECIKPSVRAVAGLTLGADPLVSGVIMASYEAVLHSDLNGLIVRKKPKGHGTGAWIEGPLPEKGSEIAILEDVITTGGSAIQAAEKVRDAGYIVNDVIAIVDRQENNEAYGLMESANLELTSLYKLDELI